jgi:hypothetical protein
MITAEEARKQTIKNAASINQAQLADLGMQIQDAVSQGEFAITVDYSFSNIRDFLEAQGYTVKEVEIHYVLYGYSISW